MFRTIAPLLGTLVAAVRAEDRRGDIVTAAGLFLIAMTLGALGLTGTSWPGRPDTPLWWFTGPTLVGCIALVWRRTRPLLVLCVVTLTFGADVALGGSVGMIVLLWEALYAVNLHGAPTARRVAAIGVGLASFAVAVVVGELTRDARAAVLGGLQAATLLVTPLWWGANVRQGRELTAAAQDREQLERERGTALLRLAEASRHDAVRAERTAVARDLHDVIASHLSAIAITSGAALAGPAGAERDRAALRSVRTESLASLEEMQAMIRVLSASPVPDEDSSGRTESGRADSGRADSGRADSGRAGSNSTGWAASGSATSGSVVAGSAAAGSDRAGTAAWRAESDRFGAGAGAGAGADADADGGSSLGFGGSIGLLAAPRAAQLAGVLDQVRLAGLDLTVTDPGGLLTGRTPLPTAVDHAVYRVVREALTNVLKHGGTRAELRVVAGERLELEVHDVGVRPGETPRARADVGGGTGIGLVSMRERVESLGGSFEAGPVRAGGASPDSTGWRVRAVLPLPGRTAAGSAPAGPAPVGSAPSAPSDPPTPEVRA
ncbi:sensor histidine kinase [Promicromonospora sp. Populi]|uniref:sensor histidine kinase n=1 Tax=Promicromonospora sp. Populi TaxID=3239420 RepID=UPI0034E1BF1D